jgi:TRAP-type uncharacterized transport system fused permease subunit
VIKCSFAAFRFALVGFTLPFIFVYRPELLLLTPGAEGYDVVALLEALWAAVSGILAFAAAISAYLLAPLTAVQRVVLSISAALLLAPGITVPIAGFNFPIQDFTGFALLVGVAMVNRKSRDA